MTTESKDIVRAIYSWTKKQQDSAHVRADGLPKTTREAAMMRGKRKAYLDVLSFLYGRYGDKVGLPLPTHHETQTPHRR